MLIYFSNCPLSKRSFSVNVTHCFVQVHAIKSYIYMHSIINLYFVKLFYKLQLASKPYHFYQYTGRCPQPRGRSLRRGPLCRYMYMWSVNWHPTSRTSWGWRIQMAQTFPRFGRGLVQYQDNLNKTKIENGCKP